MYYKLSFDIVFLCLGIVLTALVDRVILFIVHYKSSKISSHNADIQQLLFFLASFFKYFSWLSNLNGDLVTLHEDDQLLRPTII